MQKVYLYRRDNVLLVGSFYFILLNVFVMFGLVFGIENITFMCSTFIFTIQAREKNQRLKNVAKTPYVRCESIAIEIFLQLIMHRIHRMYIISCNYNNDDEDTKKISSHRCKNNNNNNSISGRKNIKHSIVIMIFWFSIDSLVELFEHKLTHTHTLTKKHPSITSGIKCISSVRSKKKS